jgi:hypothetical protein
MDWSLPLTLAKILSGIASTYFGLKALGNTHDAAGRLSPAGRHALAGLVCAGGLTVLLATFEYSKERTDDRARARTTERSFAQQESLLTKSAKVQKLLDSLQAQASSLLESQEKQRRYSDAASALLNASISMQRQVGRNTLRQLFPLGDSVRVQGDLVVPGTTSQPREALSIGRQRVVDILTLVRDTLLPTQATLDKDVRGGYWSHRLERRGPFRQLCVDSLWIVITEKGRHISVRGLGSTRNASRLSCNKTLGELQISLPHSIADASALSPLTARFTDQSEMAELFRCTTAELCDRLGDLSLLPMMWIGVDFDSLTSCTCSSDLAFLAIMSGVPSDGSDRSADNVYWRASEQFLVLDFARAEVKRHFAFQAALNPKSGRVRASGLIDLPGAFLGFSQSLITESESNSEFLASRIDALSLTFRHGRVMIPRLRLRLERSDPDVSGSMVRRELRGAHRIDRSELRSSEGLIEHELAGQLTVFDRRLEGRVAPALRGSP